MFVPVSCTKCGKPFQVPEAALGKLAPCPWCQEVVTALPVSAPVAVPQEQAQEAVKPQAAGAVQQEPLSLDDEPQSQSKPVEPSARERKIVPAAQAPVQKPQVPAAPPVPPTPGKRFVSLVVLSLVGLAVAIAVTAVTVGALRRKTGYLVSVDWRTFHAPDGSCSIDLLGAPVEDPDAPAAGGRRYNSQGWYSGTRAWVGWKDLTPAEAQMATGGDAWQLLRPAVFNPERDRLKNAFGGYEAEGGGTKTFDPLVVEYRFQTPEGLLVERITIKADGPRPRAYFVGMVGKRVTPDGPELTRLFASFQIND